MIGTLHPVIESISNVSRSSRNQVKRVWLAESFELEREKKSGVNNFLLLLDLGGLHLKLWWDPILYHWLSFRLH